MIMPKGSTHVPSYSARFGSRCDGSATQILHSATRSDGPEYPHTPGISPLAHEEVGLIL